MIYEPDYKITAGGQDVPFLFRSLTFKKYCDRKGIELDELVRMVYKTILSKDRIEAEGLQDVRDIKINDFADILLAAHETYCLYHKITFRAKEEDAFMWIDEMGGIINSRKEQMEVMLLFACKLLNIDPAMARATTDEAESGEKNAETPAMNGSPGGSSTGLDAKRA